MAANRMLQHLQAQEGQPRQDGIDIVQPRTPAESVPPSVNGAITSSGSLRG